MALEKIDLTCPKCGGNMEVDRANHSLHCPYCDHEVVLENTDTESIEEKSYARQKGILRANQENEKAKKRHKTRKIVIAVSIVLLLVLASSLYYKLQPKIDPFKYIDVSFSGKTGNGEAEIVYLDDEAKDIDLNNITYRISPDSYLSNGDTVTVSAESSDYFLSTTTKKYTVSNLYSFLTDLNSISEEAAQMIHNKSKITVEMDIGHTGYLTATPYKMFLTVNGKIGNTFYDVYKVEYKDNDDSIAERYAVAYYKNIIVYDTDEPSMSYDGTMYTGQIIRVLDKGYNGYMTGYKTIDDVKADILSHQSSAVTLQERESKINE